MKFAHLADCHIGSWREPKLAEISSKVFEKTIDDIKEKKVDFVLISGDLFNTSLPSIDKLKEVVLKLPSGKLQISKQFTLDEDMFVDFVFDITVIKAGKSGKYILKPQIAESGPNQEYTEVTPEGKIVQHKEKHQEKHEEKHGKPDSD